MRGIGVPVLAASELEKLTIQELSIRKGALLGCPPDAAWSERLWAYRRVPPADDLVVHRDDPRWHEQWLATKEAARRRRAEHVAPVWCVVANVVREHPYGPGGAVMKQGTRKLPGGARVNIVHAYWGMCEYVVAIAQRRRPLRWARVTLHAARLERFRAKLVYDPNVIDACFMHWGHTGWSEELARTGEVAFAKWAAAAHEHRDELRAGRAVLPARLHASLGGAIGKSRHWIDVRLRDERSWRGVPMQNAYFADAIDFDPQQIVEVQPAPEPSWEHDDGEE